MRADPARVWRRRRGGAIRSAAGGRSSGLYRSERMPPDHAGCLRPCAIAPASCGSRRRWRRACNHRWRSGRIWRRLWRRVRRRLLWRGRFILGRRLGRQHHHDRWGRWSGPGSGYHYRYRQLDLDHLFIRPDQLIDWSGFHLELYRAGFNQHRRRFEHDLDHFWQCFELYRRGVFEHRGGIEQLGQRVEFDR